MAPAGAHVNALTAKAADVIGAVTANAYNLLIIGVSAARVAGRPQFARLSLSTERGTNADVSWFVPRCP